MSATAYPLSWPDGLPRSASKATSAFKPRAISSALANVEDSLRRFAGDSNSKVENVVLSSNVTLGTSKPADSGVAVWFDWFGEQRCIAVDRYAKVEDNLQAIHHIIEARRTELRHGGLNIVKQTFKGFTALPAPVDWRKILNFYDGEPPSKDKVTAAYRRLAEQRHPDKGGTQEQMAELNVARDRALAEISGA